MGDKGGKKNKDRQQKQAAARKKELAKVKQEKNHKTPRA